MFTSLKQYNIKNYPTTRHVFGRFKTKILYFVRTIKKTAQSFSAYNVFLFKRLDKRVATKIGLLLLAPPIFTNCTLQ